MDRFVLSRRRKTAVTLLYSVVVGLAVALLTGRLALYNCPVSVPADARRITKLGFAHLHLDWAGCSAIVPLAPAYFGLAALLLLAIWARWS